jgi:hypothetical protein
LSYCKEFSKRPGQKKETKEKISMYEVNCNLTQIEEKISIETPYISFR